MNCLSPDDILTVWEQGHSCAPCERALLLARLASPEASREALAALPIAERDLMLLDLRERTLGPRLNAFARCPACGEALEFPLETAAVRSRMSLRGGPQEAAIGTFQFRLRPPSSADVAAVASTASLEAARLALTTCCVEEASRDGIAIDTGAVPEATLRALADRLDASDDPADIVIAMSCPACSGTWEAPFDIASYFYAELTALARRLLEEVHVLASAYGWSERNILAMSPARRQFYLERAR